MATPLVSRFQVLRFGRLFVLTLSAASFEDGRQPFFKQEFRQLQFWSWKITTILPPGSPAGPVATQVRSAGNLNGSCELQVNS
jgi:hypothetical protein